MMHRLAGATTGSWIATTRRAWIVRPRSRWIPQTRGKGCALGLGVLLWAVTEGAARAADPPARPVANPTSAVAPAAPPGAPRAALVIEPARLALGALATADIVVSTPPGHALRLAEPLPELPGVWTLATEILPVERSADRWTHRLRLRLRTRETGRFEWPAIALRVDGGDGRSATVTTETREIEVAPTLAALDRAQPPFGLRDLPADPAGGRPVAAALAGALATLFAFGLVAAVRRARRRRSDTGPTLPDAGHAATAQGEARAALEQAARDGITAQSAAGDASLALRVFLERRFSVSAIARTSEELRAGPTPWAVRSRWPRWLALFEALDAVQFPPAPVDAPARLRAALAEARALLDDLGGAGERA